MSKKIYKVEIRELLLREVKIEAKTLKEALIIVTELYNKEEIILDYSNHSKTIITELK